MEQSRHFTPTSSVYPPQVTYTCIYTYISHPTPHHSFLAWPGKCGGERGALFCLWPSPWLIAVIAGRCRGAPRRWLLTDLCGRENSMGNGREKRAFFFFSIEIPSFVHQQDRVCSVWLGLGELLLNSPSLCQPVCECLETSGSLALGTQWHYFLRHFT